MKFEVGKLYTGLIINMDYKSHMVESHDDWLHPKYFFLDEGPFLILEQLNRPDKIATGWDSYNILYNNKVYHFNYCEYDINSVFEEFEIIC